MLGGLIKSLLWSVFFWIYSNIWVFNEVRQWFLNTLHKSAGCRFWFKIRLLGEYQAWFPWSGRSPHGNTVSPQFLSGQKCHWHELPGNWPAVIGCTNIYGVTKHLDNTCTTANRNKNNTALDAPFATPLGTVWKQEMASPHHRCPLSLVKTAAAWSQLPGKKN